VFFGFVLFGCFICVVRLLFVLFSCFICVRLFVLFGCFICVVLLLFLLFYVLFVCKCVLSPGDNPIAVNKYIISYHISHTSYRFRV